LVQAFKFNRRDTQTHRQYGDLISLLLFFKIKKRRLTRGQLQSEGILLKESINVSEKCVYYLLVYFMRKL
jgi:hypothetical protein